jgi:hypothetical protein
MGMEVMSLSGAGESAQLPETEQRRNARKESERLMRRAFQEWIGRSRCPALF